MPSHVIDFTGLSPYSSMRYFIRDFLRAALGLIAGFFFAEGLVFADSLLAADLNADVAFELDNRSRTVPPAAQVRFLPPRVLWPHEPDRQQRLSWQFDAWFPTFLPSLSSRSVAIFVSLLIRARIYLTHLTVFANLFSHERCTSRKLDGRDSILFGRE
jgi:hypothetical protein